MLRISPFENFMAFSDWMYTKTDATHRIALDRLANLVREWLVERGMPAGDAATILASDYAGRVDGHSAASKPKAAAPERQVRHLAA
jgi:hypothetical protein